MVRIVIVLVTVDHVRSGNHDRLFSLHDEDDLDVEELIPKASEDVHELVVEQCFLEELSLMLVELLLIDATLEIESVPQIEPMELVSEHGNRLIGDVWQVLAEEEPHTRNQAVAIVRHVHALQAELCQEGLYL